MHIHNRNLTKNKQTNKDNKNYMTDHIHNAVSYLYQPRLEIVINDDVIAITLKAMPIISYYILQEEQKRSVNYWLYKAKRKMCCIILRDRSLSKTIYVTDRKAPTDPLPPPTPTQHQHPTPPIF